MWFHGHKNIYILYTADFLLEMIITTIKSKTVVAFVI